MDRGKPKYSGGKTCASATFSTTNPRWTDLGSNTDLCGDRPATNSLNHGTAKVFQVTSFGFVNKPSSDLFLFMKSRPVKLILAYRQ
jgi:hypothetical protein